MSNTTQTSKFKTKFLIVVWCFPPLPCSPHSLYRTHTAWPFSELLVFHQAQLSASPVVAVGLSGKRKGQGTQPRGGQLAGPGCCLRGVIPSAPRSHLSYLLSQSGLSSQLLFTKLYSPLLLLLMNLST